MKRTQIIIIAIAAFVMLWMYSQSGNASQAICDDGRDISRSHLKIHPVRSGKAERDRAGLGVPLVYTL